MVGTRQVLLFARASRSPCSRNIPCSSESTPALAAIRQLAGSLAWHAILNPALCASSTATESNFSLNGISAASLGRAPSFQPDSATLISLRLSQSPSESNLVAREPRQSVWRRKRTCRGGQSRSRLHECLGRLSRLPAPYALA